MFTLTPFVRDEILRWAREHPTIEVTGFVKEHPNGTQEVVPMSNRAAVPERDYAWDPEEMRRRFEEMDKEGAHWIAIYHSHPTSFAEPSETDMKAALHEDMVYLIAGQGKLTAWRCIEQGILLSEPMAVQ